MIIGPGEAGLRLDIALSRLIPGESRSAVQRLIREGRVTVRGVAAKPGQKAAAGQPVLVVKPPLRPAEAGPEDIPLAILHEDSEIIVVNKPAGMVTHPAPGSRSSTLVNALLHHSPELSGIGGVMRPGIVHRLDKGTSGVMVVAKNDRAHRSLASQFKRHRVTKTYLALVWDNVAADEGAVDLPIGRDRRDRKKISGRSDKPREAFTSFRVLRRLGWATLLEVSPRTGRTHQIRVHLAHARHPVVGDPLYGRRFDPSRVPAPWRARVAELKRPLLHAWKLAFSHPGDGREMSFAAGPPPDFAPFAEDFS